MTGPLAGKSRIGLDIGGVPKQSKISLICITDKRQRPGGYSVRISTPFVSPPKFNYALGRPQGRATRTSRPLSRSIGEQ